MSHPLASYAAVVRPVVDRLHVGVRHASRPAVRELYAPLGLLPGLEINLLYAMLDHPVPEAAVAARMVYLPFAAGAEEARGLAVRSGGSWDWTERGRELAVGVEGALAAAAEALWSFTPSPALAGVSAVEAALPLVGRLLEAGAARGGPVFAAFTPTWEAPGASAAGLLVSRLEALRHHRADAHRAAWAAAGLSVDEVVALESGPMWEQVEAETNRLDAPIYEALDARERLVLLGALGALGDGLRPE
ncbi:hypothetical protein SAMN05216298_1632 [Glycomyces sambucus]|uniref:Uncharacterized protein n=1 Tax=Glycomyces sambucus TaxID=380244 RepID=A0A1G9F7U9_9ACTN|nr:hypothetical protein [Glycomyces sambucus]SDK84472.1 hypothetical protein SAMN05216298_1632 [Glycomyces sambucus]